MLKQIIAFRVPIATKIMIAAQLFFYYSYSKFNENPIKDLIADNVSQTEAQVDGHCDLTRPFF
jgi:hypothetical protein